MLKAFIEIPQGDDRRRHMKYDKSGMIDLGPLKDAIPLNDGKMPVHYGYIIDTHNKEEASEHPEELDVVIFSDRNLEVAAEISIEPIAVLKREDKDEKIVAVDLGHTTFTNWEGVPEDAKKLVIDYFGYKSPVIEIGDREMATKLIEDSKI